MSTYRETVTALSPTHAWYLDETSGTTADDAVGSYDGTYTGSPTLNQTGLIAEGTAVSFGGSNYVSVPDAADFKNFSSLSFTCVIEAGSTLTSGAGFITHHGTSPDTTAGSWYFSCWSGQLFFGGGDGSANQQANVSHSLSTSTRYHLGVVWTGSVVRFYVDGTQVGTDQSLTGIGGGSSTSTVHIAGESDLGWFPGTMDEVAYWKNTALTGTDMANLAAALDNTTPAAPDNTVAPVASGTAAVDSIVTTTNGTWTGSPTPTFTYQWQRDDTGGGTYSNISSATSASYTLTLTDQDCQVRCVVTGTNTEGSDTGTSNALGPVGPAVPPTVLTQYFPEDYGAVRDGSTDDTGAIVDCINAAVAACVADETYYCEVQFRPGIYQLSSATTKGGSTLGNAQIPLPAIVPETDQKVIIKLKGFGRASAMHWEANDALEIGTVLRTTLTGLSADGTWGAPSVIGTATTQVGSGGLAPDFSNIHVVVDGLTVMAPADPGIIGLDLRGAANASVLDYSAFTSEVPSDFGGFSFLPSNGLGIGLAMPGAGNNAVCDIGVFSCEGWCTALSIAEHISADRILAVYCSTAVFIASERLSNSTNHASTIRYLCAEAVNTAIEYHANDKFALVIDALDVEVQDSGTHIVDESNTLRGSINWNDYQDKAPRVTGCEHVRITDLAQSRGSVTAPSVPATTVALRNPFFRDAVVRVSGGTVTDVSVSGVSQGVTSGMVVVPTTHTITLTYSSAPSWTWQLL